jgi:hypothetical protein
MQTFAAFRPRCLILGVLLCALAAVLVVLPAGRTAEPAARQPMDRAIDRALEFLKNQQDRGDGSWSVHSRKNVAISALAVMAFLSAGHVPGEGPYGEAVEKGVRWVLRSQQGNGLFASDGGHEMYHHGICTLMLAEVAGMTDGKLAEEVREKLEKAVKVILVAQRTANNEHRGGWRYRVNSYDSDISVTGWQLLALRAAKNLGCDVPPERIEMAVDYIKRCRDPRTGGFCYTPRGGLTVPCTGTCILGLELCGKDRHHTPEALKAGSYLIDHPPRWGDRHFFYGVYYCSQATFQLGKNYWKSYREQMHRVLLGNQNPNGSWLGNDGYGANYSTAMGVLALTVEYRYLPIYQRDEGALEPSAPK